MARLRHIRIVIEFVIVKTFSRLNYYVNFLTDRNCAEDFHILP